ncbi:ARM repeat-containing protein [Auriscalpium vulgare]|uniref:ARM repeat-containing protein n=1 Tax=Auriscalpium vulgare TaxID=40419 RepID=A0ACB8S8G2_9AGAM|nr:ARM repeat-containing protein [Auriscalpium vulgare]
MPKENRKRGKKHKKSAQAQRADEPEALPLEEGPKEIEDQQSGPSWIVPAQAGADEADRDAPFGYVDADIKSYFRNVDTQLKDWQENAADDGEHGGDVDPNENRRIFLMAALQEMVGQERQLSTDPECASVLERMVYSMDDFVRRVFVDSLRGSYEQLAKHRFASHVVQTLLTVAADTVSRESRGIMPAFDGNSDKGELLTLSQLVLDLVEELTPSFSSLILDQFASHVLRALLMLLAPQAFPTATHSSAAPVRSKKSAAWKTKQGPLKSIFQDTEGKGKAPAEKQTAEPSAFRNAARKLVLVLQKDLGENEVRSLAANKVASPVLQMLLEIEADQGLTDEPGSLMDRVLVGLITLHHNDPSAVPEASDFLATLFRDPTSSHLLETLIVRAPGPIFVLLWSTYFEGKLPKLALHPVANFVVAKAIGRVNEQQLCGVLEELQPSWKKLVQNSRVGVLRAVADRSAALGVQENDVCEAVFTAFDLHTPEDRKFVVQCGLRVYSLQASDSTSLESKTSGALLLQSLLHLSHPHNDAVISSIQAMSVVEIIALAHNPTSSRVLDELLQSPTVPSKAKRAFILSLIGHYHVLVDDRIGSRVGDRCWASADPYLKEKIGRSLIAHETDLAGSFYGKFFARNLNLHLLQRRPEDWRNLQASRALAARTNGDTKPPTDSTLDMRKKRKRDSAKSGDEIDVLFHEALGAGVKKGALTEVDSQPPGSAHKTAGGRTDGGLNAVLDAIQSAPKSEAFSRKKKRPH